MTTLGTLVKGYGLTVVPLPFDPARIMLEITAAVGRANLTAGATPVDLGSPAAITAALIAWTYQDDDAHEPCSLVACRAPLHPGPCKGWKGTLHDVSPNIWKQVEDERVAKANARRTKRIAELKSQGKPIPRKLLDPIKPKPAPGTGAGGAAATPLGKVNQQADLAGGQAHTTSQAINKAAGISANTAPLPTGPKGKKPTVAGRGPAFVITQPKVTDQYKLDKAAKLTPQEWSDLTPADRKAIRDELEAIKVRGFGPQQTRADALLAKLPAANTLGTPTPAAAAPTPQTPSATPGKTTLGQASKTIPPASTATQGRAAAVAQAGAALAITEALHGKQNVGVAQLASQLDALKAKGDLKDQQGFKLLVDRLANNALQKASAANMPGLGHGTNDVGIKEFNREISDHILDGKPGLPPLIQRVKTAQAAKAKADAAPPPAAPAAQPNAPAVSTAVPGKAPSGAIPDAAPKTATPTLPSPGPAPATAPSGVPGTPPTPAKAAPASPPSAPSGGTPKAFTPDVQHARAVAGRAVGRPTSKAHVDAYGKLSKADFDSLDSQTQRTIRDDLANAKAKFLDPKKSQAAQDLLDRFGSRHTSPAPGGPAPSGASSAPKSAPGPAAHPKGYSDPQQQAVKAATGGMIVTDDVLKSVARLSPAQVTSLDDADKKAILGRLAFVATHPKATAEQKAKAAAYGRMINSGSVAQTSRKWDHTPSLGELHTEEKSTGVAERTKALEAAKAKSGLAPGTQPIDRVKALSGLTKPQFDALTPDEQRQITDALHQLNRDRIHNGGSMEIDAGVKKAILAYTGIHPALHRMKQAEADYKAGKIDGEELHSQWLAARTQAPGTTDKPAQAELAKEAARIARENPGLTTYVRANMVGEPVYGHPAYHAISLARMKHMFDDAPRLSTSDMRQMFRPTPAELKTVDPIHAQAVQEMQLNALSTGLYGNPGSTAGSPWGVSTRNEAVNAYLGITAGGEVSPDRLAAYRALPDSVRLSIRKVMRQRLRDQTKNSAKTDTWLALRELEGEKPLDGDLRKAVFAATDEYSLSGKLDDYRKVDPADFQKLPDFVQDAMIGDLAKIHQRAVSVGPTHTMSPTDNPLKVFPHALSAHLLGNRVAPADRNLRNVSDVVNYGRDLVAPESRVQTYNKLTPKQVQDLSGLVEKDMFDDLHKIENDSALPVQTRYDAALNGQVLLKQSSQIALNSGQLSAVQAADLNANSRYPDAGAALAFHNLTKADYDALSPAFRAAIDARINDLPASPQQVLTAKFHPPVVSNLPSGTVPTTAQANVPPHVQAALDTLYGVDPKSHTMAHQLKTYGALRGSDFNSFNVQEQQQLLSDLSFIETTAKGPSAAKAKLLIDRFTPAGTPSGQTPGNPAVIPPANSVPGQVRYATPQVGTLVQATNKGKGGDGWISTPGGKRVWGKYGAAGLLLMHQDPGTGERRYLMVQRGPGISDPGKWQFPGGAIDEKETFHQGGAREVIEELGFKDLDLKSAAVHGEHTNAIPGSTWKYVSIAAQVPQMLKPDLSTHHARMETSDAKWMTEAEIKALDTSGSLLAPLAGGKLEQNVMSLFPATGGGIPATGKLGQIARPGPVTKRLGRLTMPPGGRQAPASFNAWTLPHKKSTGKNLVASKADIDFQRQKIKADRKLFDGKTADGRLAAIGAQQGFDDTPTVKSKSEIDQLLATGDYIEAWRGVTGAGGGWSARGRGRSGGKTAAQINEEMRSGPAYYGTGIFGNGYYLATQKRVAEQYSDHTKGSLVRILIPKSAVMEKYDKVEKEAQANSSRVSKARGSSGYELSTFWDPGRWGAAKGIDGIEINPHHRAHAGGGASHVASAGKPAYNWLNRSVLIIQKEPG